MHPPLNDPPHDAPEPPHRAAKGLDITIYVVDFCSIYYVTRRKFYHEDWLMRFQICQYLITHMVGSLCGGCTVLVVTLLRKLVWYTANTSRLLLGVEDTVDIKQYRTKGQKNEENNKNNKFVGRCFIVTCPASSTRRRSPHHTCFGFFQADSLRG